MNTNVLGCWPFKGCLYHLFSKLWYGKQSRGPSPKKYVSISASVPHSRWMEVEQKILGCCSNVQMQCPGKLQKWVLEQCSGNYSLAALCKLSKPAAILLRMETTSRTVKVTACNWSTKEWRRGRVKLQGRRAGIRKWNELHLQGKSWG